jgi:uncharacterized protein (DUF488 family)
LRVYTIGHSTRTLEEFRRILSTNGVTVLADVRSFPRSIRNPQFNTGIIGSELVKDGIEYVWLQKLGGRRKGFGNVSRNACWKNKSFRNFADYMETHQFLEGIQELTQLTKRGSTAIMCAEALYWSCHRSMIADFLKSKGIEVAHIFDGKHMREHEYTQCARIVDGRLTYHE